jgi:hypothetical protein
MHAPPRIFYGGGLTRARPQVHACTCSAVTSAMLYRVANALQVGLGRIALRK